MARLLSHTWTEDPPKPLAYTKISIFYILNQILVYIYGVGRASEGDFSMKVPLNMKFKSENIIKCHLGGKVCKLRMYPALYPQYPHFCRVVYSASPRFKRVLHARPKPSLAIALLPLFRLLRLCSLCPSSASPFLRSSWLLCALSGPSSSYLFFLALLSSVGLDLLLFSTLYVSSARL